MDIEENISKINEHIERVKEYLEYGMPYSEYLDLQISFETILNELEKKDKIINEILNYFQSGLSMCEDCENWIDNEHCKKCLKEHFTNKVEEDK